MPREGGKLGSPGETNIEIVRAPILGDLRFLAIGGWKLLSYRKGLVKILPGQAEFAAGDTR